MENSHFHLLWNVLPIEIDACIWHV